MSRGWAGFGNFLAAAVAWKSSGAPQATWDVGPCRKMRRVQKISGQTGCNDPSNSGPGLEILEPSYHRIVIPWNS